MRRQGRRRSAHQSIGVGLGHTKHPGQRHRAGPISGTEGLERLTPIDDSGGSTAITASPLGRLGTKDDIAALAMFLSSSAAGYISGAVIPCEGGGAIDSVKAGIEEAGRSATAAVKAGS
jgi:NAD(P)-dependent dehydrogenase (short-subunit alcohol dehydrogenase family)